MNDEVKYNIPAVAPNGAIYLFKGLTEQAVSRLQNDDDYLDCLLCYAFRTKLHPIQGIIYYDPLWETKFRPIPVPRSLATGEPPKPCVKAVQVASVAGRNIEVVSKAVEPDEMETGIANLSPLKQGLQAADNTQAETNIQAGIESVQPEEISMGIGNLSPLKALQADKAQTETSIQAANESEQDEIATGIRNLSPFKPLQTDKAQAGMNIQETNFVSEKRSSSALTPVQRSKKKLSRTLSPSSVSACADFMDLGCSPIDWNRNDYSIEVVVSNMPRPYFKGHFSFTLDMEIRSNIKGVNFPSKIFMCPDKMEANNSICVLLSSSEIADKLCALQTIKYRGNTLIIKKVSMATLMNLPNPCFEDFLEFTLEECLKKELPCGILDRNEKYVVNLSNYCGTSNSADVEFSSVQIKVAATHSVKEFMCDGKLVKIRDHLETAPCALSKGTSINSVHIGNCKVSNACDTLVVSNISTNVPFYKEEFIQTILSVLDSDGLLHEHEGRAVSECSELSADGQVQLKFSNNDQAAVACAISEVCWNGQKLKFTLSDSIITDNTWNSVSKPSNCPKQLSKADNFSKIVAQSCSPVEHLDQALDSDKEEENVADTEPHIFLASEEGTIKFLRNIVRLKSTFTTTNHTSAFARLEADLKVDERVICDVPHLKTKRTYFLKEYNRHKKNGNTSWDRFDVCAVMKGDKEVSCLQNTIYDPMKCATSGEVSLAEELSKFRQGAVWTKLSTRALIEVRMYYKSRFDQGPNRHTELWRKVQSRLKDMNFHYLPSQCENKMDSLMTGYRKEFKRRNCTGAPATDFNEPLFDFFEEMEPLMRGDVTVEALLTIAAGSTNGLKERSDLHEVSGKVKSSKFVPLKERSVTALEILADSIRRKTDLAEQYMNKSLSPP